MAITIFSSEEYSTVRCSIHVNGRLTFSWGAIDELGLQNKRSIALGKHDDDRDSKTLCMYVFENYRGDAFRINWSGAYCYINAKALFDELKYDYANKYIFFNIVKSPAFDKDQYYKLIYRQKTRISFSYR